MRPPSTRLTTCGTGSAEGSARTSSSVLGASTKIMSAPASTYRWARSKAASQPSTALASVRAITSRSSSRRASTAARTRPTISWAGTSSLPSKCPHRLGAAWSSSWMASAPARSSSRTVLVTFTALPNPVSASTTSGTETASRMAATWETSSVRVTSPMSGTPR